MWRSVKRNCSENSSRLILTSLAVIFLATTLPKTLKPVSKDKAHLKDVGRYVRQLHGTGDLTIATSDRRVAYYAGARAVSLQSPSFDSDMGVQFQKQQIDFLVADPRVLKRRFPGLLESLQSQGLQIEMEFVGPEGDRMIVYRRG